MATQTSLHRTTAPSVTAPASLFGFASRAIAAYLPFLMRRPAGLGRHTAPTRINLSLSMPRFSPPLSSWQQIIVNIFSCILSHIPNESSMPVGDRQCRSCKQPLSKHASRHKHMYCGPRGRACISHVKPRGIEKASEKQQRKQLKARHDLARGSLKPRLEASVAPTYVQISGVLADSQATNAHLFSNCARTAAVFRELQEQFGEDRAVLRCFCHRRGDTDAIVAFDDRQVAEALVTAVNRDQGFTVLGSGRLREEIKAVIKAKLLLTDEDQVAFLTELTAPAASGQRPVPTRWKPRVSFKS